MGACFTCVPLWLRSIRSWGTTNSVHRPSIRVLGRPTEAGCRQAAGVLQVCSGRRRRAGYRNARRRRTRWLRSRPGCHGARGPAGKGLKICPLCNTLITEAQLRVSTTDAAQKAAWSALFDVLATCATHSYFPRARLYSTRSSEKPWLSKSHNDVLNDYAEAALDRYSLVKHVR